ncbi:MAG: hypothetical protein H6659_07390 [Ardenticatenaceae bacterium]|nr:hypothetical protein [Ardenticatenaceae bacterium]
MNATDAINQSFIIRVWIEEPASNDHPAVWRGHITHVPTGRRKYIRDLHQIAQIIAPYLSELGVEFTTGSSEC